MFKLIIEDDEGHTTVVPLVKEEVTIGRKEGNTIRLTERNVSRHHARLIRSNGSVFIEDLDSYNGVKVNGDRIAARTTIREGDLVEIGDYHFAIQWVPDTDAPPAPAAPTEKEKPPSLPQAARPPQPVDGATAILRLPVEEKAAAAAGEPGRARTIPDNQAGRLVVVSTELAGTSFLLDRTEMTIGRSEECDILLAHRSVSSVHAKIVFDGGIYRVIDQDSANGILVNGEEYARVDVRKGDIIELGHVKLRYVAPGEEFHFTPGGAPAAPAQAAAAPSPFDEFEKPQKSKMPLMLGLGAVGVVAVGLTFFLLRSGGKEGSQPAPEADAGAIAIAADAGGAEPGVDEVTSLFKQGLDQRSQRNWEAAEKNFLAVLDKNSEHMAARNNLEMVRKEKGYQQIMERAKKAISDRDWDAALGYLSEIPEDSVYRKEVEPLRPEVQSQYKLSHLNQAKRLIEQNQFAEAIRHADSVLAEDEKNLAALNLKKEAETLLRRRNVKPPEPVKPPDRPKPPEARAEVNREQLKSLSQEAYALSKAGQYERASEVYLRILKVDPGYCNAIAGLGYTSAKMGNREKTIQYNRLFIQKCPNDQRVVQARNVLRQLEGGSP